jgi:hypothetical protein
MATDNVTVKINPNDTGNPVDKLAQLIGGGVWPTSAISPEQLETDGPALADSADFIGRLIERRKMTT